ncbi:MAG: chromosome segregation protein SMC [Burkholderiales bacterium]|nr:chromosome segregation protein SMC [Burkholderiales bacterium]
MRLTQIRLAGFKSFVDPTHIDIPGRLVGVVGPNGCGKSNIIDAVRWVLGETKASALRGESMQDVIFNGSALRNPVARASVELVFDNSLGKAAGQWSQYAEISVKRVLQRDGESSYFINNAHVRRRDVQDIFLGTGVGPRAYAIIEQGMISRVIEAKPEELRVFLEEAAGVSKYRERRRETEHRLGDTRENLARVDDIRRELESQIEKLTHQAEIATQYKALAAEAQLKQNLLWLLRKQEAANEAERQRREIDKAVNELEAETARLREIERRLETARTEHYAAADAVGSAQGALYDVNTEISRLEAEIRFIGETRQRLEAQVGQLGLQLDQWQQSRSELDEALAAWVVRKEAAAERVRTAEAQSADERAKLPAAEEAYRAEQLRLGEARNAVARAEQALQVEQTTLAHLGRVLQQLELRSERLTGELAQLAEPDPERVAELQAQSESAMASLGRLAEEIAAAEAELPAREAAQRAATESLQQLERDRSTLEGRLSALKRMQERVEENEQVHDWLERHALAALPRLWQKITVEPGWETAVESVLRERLHSLELADPAAIQQLLDDPPAARLAVFARGEDGVETVAVPGRKGLGTLVRYTDQGVRGLVQEWLAGYYAVDGTPRLLERLALPAGAVLVNREGHQFGRFSVSFHGPDSGDAGILVRQREIEALGVELAGYASQVAEAQSVVAREEGGLAERRTLLGELRAREADLNQTRHALELEHLRLTEVATRVRERGEQIRRELDEIGQQHAAERERQSAAEANILEHQNAIDRQYAACESVKAAHDEADRRLASQREAAQAADRTAQEAVFISRECGSKISEIERSLQTILEQIDGAGARREAARAELSGLEDTALRATLETALGQRLAREEALAGVRNHQETLGAQLRKAEEARLTSEQRLPPLRDRIGELRLKEQAARLSQEQYANQLVEAGADEAALASSLEKGMRPNALQAEIGRLHQAMEELGAINMAALEELAASEERKAFLDAQATDLAEALATLENAIRRIDRETRDMLRQTFDEANRHFGALFPTLFGGGEARLVMTGEEILDCGVEVRAQPPGKRNSTIHLLSGGEKALTAIALVFSLFQLNPAPFCLLDEVDAPLDDANTERFCRLVKKMSEQTQFAFISHNKITMEIAEQLIGVTMQESGVSRVVAVDIEEALRMKEAVAA